MRIALVNPPLLSLPAVQPPLGLCSLAAWMIRAGHQVALIDLDLDGRTVDGEPGTAQERLFIAKLREAAPDLVAFTSMYNNSLYAEQLIRASKRVFPHTPITAGGAHFGAQGEIALRRLPDLDFVIEGEGEAALAALASALATGAPLADVPNLCHRHDGRIVRNARAPLLQLEALPNVWATVAPFVDLGRYEANLPKGDPIRGMFLEAGRGCPFRCEFCAPSVFWNRRYRVRPPAAIIDEMAYMHGTHGYKSFVLVHDLLTADRNYVDSLCDAFLEAGLPVQWMANARTDLGTEDLFAKMRGAGCWKLFFGVETGSDRMQRVVGKHLELESVVSVIRQAELSGINTTCSFVIGHPEETPDDLTQTLHLAVRLKLWGSETAQFHRMRLFPPAPMMKAEHARSFDMETLRLEYPFKDVLPADVEAIVADPAFFSGYFAPRSAAGQPHELAQVELFFTQAIALTPLTMGALLDFAGGRVLDQFYALLRDEGTIDRYIFDPTHVDLVQNGSCLETYLQRLIVSICAVGETWTAGFALSLLEYEIARLFMRYGARRDKEGWMYYHDGCLELSVRFDLERTLDILRQGLPPTRDMAREVRLLLIRDTNDELHVYEA